MSIFKDFDAARRERERVEPEFRLGGERFRCVPVPPAGPSLDLIGLTTAQAYRAWIRSCLRDDDAVYDGDTEVEKSSLERFDLLLYRRHDAVSIDDLIDVSNWLSEVYVGRPTGRSSDSSDGPPADGQPSRVVSLSRGEIRSA